MFMVSAGVRVSAPGCMTATSLPFCSTCGGRPGENSRSLTPWPVFSIVAMRAGTEKRNGCCADTALLAAVGAAFAAATDTVLPGVEVIDAVSLLDMGPLSIARRNLPRPGQTGGPNHPTRAASSAHLTLVIGGCGQSVNSAGVRE